MSWQLTGIRQDAWTDAHGMEVELDKPAHQQGRYLHPSELGPSGVVQVIKTQA